MKKLTATLLATAVATVAMPTFADTGMYVGLKAGKQLVKRNTVVVDQNPSFMHLDKPSNFGVTAGYQLNNNIGVEVEYTTTGTQHSNVSSGQDGTTTTENRRVEEKIQSLGAYVTARHDLNNLPMYLKAKVGASQTQYENRYHWTEVKKHTQIKVDPVTGDRSAEEVEVRNSWQSKKTKDKVSASGGVAVGVKPLKNSDKLSVELEYNYLNKDVQSIGFGTQYQF